MDSGTTKVRLANAADAGAIADIMIAARQAGLPYLKSRYGREQIHNWIGLTVLKKSTVWLAEVDENIVGFLALTDEELDHIYIHPNFWNLGIGSMLLGFAKEQSKKLMLYTFQRNHRSRRFYEKHGFRLIALGDGSSNEELEPDALYEWSDEIRL